MFGECRGLIVMSGLCALVEMHWRFFCRWMLWHLLNTASGTVCIYGKLSTDGLLRMNFFSNDVADKIPTMCSNSKNDPQWAGFTHSPVTQGGNP